MVHATSLLAGRRRSRSCAVTGWPARRARAGAGRGGRARRDHPGAPARTASRPVRERRSHSRCDNRRCDRGRMRRRTYWRRGDGASTASTAAANSQWRETTCRSRRRRGSRRRSLVLSGEPLEHASCSSVASSKSPFGRMWRLLSVTSVTLALECGFAASSLSVTTGACDGSETPDLALRRGCDGCDG
jgi:hypothetical protein